MTESILVALITGGLALIGVIISNMTARQKSAAELKQAQAVTDTKLDALTAEVRKHNGFAERIPVIEEQIKVANHRIEDLEKKVG